jgi:hypothetical protein
LLYAGDDGGGLMTVKEGWRRRQWWRAWNENMWRVKHGVLIFWCDAHHQ